MKKFMMFFVNFLTLLRIVGVFFIVPIFTLYGGVFACVFSALLYLTDMIDGILARKFRVSTFFGSMFDGIADKFFSLANLIVLLNATNYSLFPIFCEVLIFLVQTVKYFNNYNIQSSMTGKAKTWIIAITVALVYFVSDINSVVVLPFRVIYYIENLNPALLYLLIFAPLYIFELATIMSYLRFLPSNDRKNNRMPDITEKLQIEHSFADKFSNFCYIWFNNELYEKYKDSTALRDMRKYLKSTIKE